MTAENFAGFVITDSRTGRRVSVVSFRSRELAEWQVERWRARDAHGGRPDIHESVPYFTVSRLDWLPDDAA